MDNWFVYIAETANGTYYTGISTDVAKRIAKHNSGHGAKFARLHGQFKLVYTSPALTRSEALKREFEIKSWPKAKKRLLVAANYC
jgi:predicted GIY-YIG superfamily endonuclease